jgi:CO/xanthine dehydrogenase FAD-binding subunit
MRLDDLEQRLRGQALAGAAQLVSAAHFDCLSPIDDVRAPASYRIDAVEEAVRRLLASASPTAGRDS